LKDSVNVTINNLQVAGPNILVCGFMWYPPPPDNTQQPRWIEVGYSGAHEAQHGLEISGGSNITINGGKIYGMSGDGVYIANHPDLVTINDLSTECTGRSSISNVGSTRVTVNRGSFHRSGLWIFNIEPFGLNYVHDYTIAGARVGYSNWQWLLSTGKEEDFSCNIRNVRITVNRSGAGFDLAPNGMAPNINRCVTSAFQITVL
jgi:hypothetical protein